MQNKIAFIFGVIGGGGGGGGGGGYQIQIDTMHVLKIFYILQKNEGLLYLS